MLAPYRRLFAVPGGWKFSLAGFILRLPIAMLYLALVLFVVAETDSYAIAGALTMAASIVVTVAAPLWSRAADQYGQRRILTITVPLHIFFLGLFVYLLKSDAPTVFWFTSALLFETFVIGSGPLVRRRWVHAIGDDVALTDTAYSFEAFVDEVIFTSGPLIATLLAAAFAPEFAIYVAMACVALGALFFASQSATEPPPHPREPNSDRSLLIRSRFIRALFIPLMLCGAFFNSMGLIVVGYNDEFGSREWSGIYIAIWSLSSGISALVLGSIKWRRNESFRFLVSITSLFALTVPIYVAAQLAPGSLFFMGLALFANGLAVAPALASALAAAERSVDEQNKTEVLAWTISALTFGGSLTPALTGYIIDNRGISVAFIIPIICMGLSVLSLLPYLSLWRTKARNISL
jgi:MFS family permease